jgi:isoaspartyl peptidase/L-asparaginase-like protein (Ntn-hydrolase superfamily)
MSLFSSGDGYRQRAEEALNMAIDVSEYQSNVDFQRGLLANIRQHRMASAQLDLLNYSDSFTSSSAAGAKAMIDTGLSDITRYSYESSQRGQEIADYKQEYEKNIRKYQKQQNRRGTAFKVIGAIAGAATGGLAAGAVAGGMSAAAGAGLGMQVGGGIGQIASDTGQTSAGINNIIGGVGNYLTYRDNQYYNERMLAMYKNYMERMYPTSGEQYTTGALDIRPEQYRQVNIILGGQKYEVSTIK